MNNKKETQLDHDKFIEVIKEEENKLSEDNRKVVADAYQKILYLDVEQANQKFQEDAEDFFGFLDKIEKNEENCTYISRTIMRLGGLLKIEWFRPVFLKFVERIEQKGYLKDTDFEKVLHSARCAYEAYGIHEDHKITAIVENYLGAAYTRTYTALDTQEEKEKERIIVTAAHCEWYAAQYYKEHPEEFAHVKETYPNTYQLIEPFMKLVEEDVNKAGDQAVEVLLQYASNVTDARELRMSLRKAYYKIVSKNQETAFVQGNQSYKRSGEKVGRNDPCPCGSGKKYKQCCGKN